MTIRSSGKIICYGGDRDERGVSGMLTHPPLLAVVWYNAEMDRLEMERISWAAANELAPADMAVISKQLQEARAEDAKRFLQSAEAA
jgi:hypothetical protein